MPSIISAPSTIEMPTAIPSFAPVRPSASPGAGPWPDIDSTISAEADEQRDAHAHLHLPLD